MRATSIIAGIYGLLIALGGVMGFAMAHSKMSILTGVPSGIFLMICAWAMRKGDRPPYYLALLVTVALLVFFGHGYLVSHKMMPAGSGLAMAVVALVSMIATARKPDAAA